VRLGQKDYIAYAAACAVVLLSAEAQTLVGNLELLAKRVPGANLGSILCNRLYFNVCLIAPLLWFARSLWASQTGVSFALLAVVLSAFFPGSYGDSDSVKMGLRSEAVVSAALLLGRLVVPATLHLFWIIFCVEIIGRSLVGFMFATRGRHFRLVPDFHCLTVACRFGVILLFQMAFQRLEITALPKIALTKSLVVTWAAGSNVLFALNAVLYQAFIGHRVVEDDSAIWHQRWRVWAAVSVLLAFVAVLFGATLGFRRSGIPVDSAISIGLLGIYFFALTFENFHYMEFFFSMDIRRMLTLAISRVLIVLVFVGMVAAGVRGMVCLATLLAGKMLAALVEMKLVSLSHASESLNLDSDALIEAHHQ
jgi:hypothetical protein